MDHATETAEDYVEAIADLIGQQGSCRIADLSRRFAVTHVTVTRIVSRLHAEGLVDTEPYRPVRLTAKGKRLADRCRRRHEIVVRFLIALGVEP
ncbi:MAG TPA: MarR family transcriptional regulator, partial [Pirellulaceae bacterium]|nr:MarR family transcriptional regulator [Pirellulaceae bacterium]